MRRAALATPLLGGLVVLALLAFSIGGDGDGPRATESALSGTTTGPRAGDAAAEGPGGGDTNANAEAGSVTAAGGGDQTTGGSRGDDGGRRPGTGATARAGAEGRGDGGGRSGADAGEEGEPPITDCQAYPPRITVHLPWCRDPSHHRADRRGGPSPGSAPVGGADLDARATVVGAGGGHGTGAGERRSGHVAQTRRGGHDRAADGHRSGRHGSRGGSPTIVVTPLAVVAPIISVGPPPRRPPATSAARSAGSSHGRSHHRPTRDPHPGERPNSRDTSGSNTGANSISHPRPGSPRLDAPDSTNRPDRDFGAIAAATHILGTEATSVDAGRSNDAPRSNAGSGSAGGRFTMSGRSGTLDRNTGTGPADTSDVADGAELTRYGDQSAADGRSAPSTRDGDPAAAPPPALEQEQDARCPVAGGWCGSEGEAPAAAELGSTGDESAAGEAAADTPPASEGVQPGRTEGAESGAFWRGSSEDDATPAAAAAPSTEPATPPAPAEDSATGADDLVAAGAVVAETVPVDMATPTGTFMEATG